MGPAAEHKRKRSDEDKHARKKRKLDQLYEEISLIHSQILSLDFTPNELSNPATSRYIPWPSPLPPPRDRFVTSCSEDGVTNFEYMGRSMFKEVLKEVTGSWVTKPYNKLYLYGPSGVGKSHLLAAIVLCLTRQGKRVVYIPDCRALLAEEDLILYIKAALLFAFHNDKDSCDAIAAAVQVDGLIDFIQDQPMEGHYVIVDQMNALELNEGKDPATNEKVMVSNILACFGSRQKYIFSAAAGKQSHRRVHEKQTATQVFHIDTGMTKVCPHFFELPCLTSLG